MASHSWQRILKALFRNQTHSSRSNKRRHTPRSSRLQLEALEDRLVPSTLSTLASFNGVTPTGPLAADSSGNLFGTTANGTGGTLFEVVKGSGTITTLYTFTGVTPSSSVVVDSKDDVFGTTTNGGSGSGTVFELANGANNITTLGTFSGTANNASTGAKPNGIAFMDSSGNLFGTTNSGGTGGGASGYGTVFEVANNNGTYTLTSLASFDKQNGANPSGSIAQDSNGDLFGTTSGGGSGFLGTVFEVTKNNGTYSLNPNNAFASFSGSNGATPQSGVVADSQGNLYGTASASGANADGTVFEVKQGTTTITTLASFNGTNGKTPTGTLTLDGNGDLFGTTTAGGANGFGAVFEVVQGSGAITDPFSFNNDSNGANPGGGVISTNNALFGTTSKAGANQNGTVFELTGSLQPTLNVSDGGTYTSNPMAATATAVASDGKTPVAGSFTYNYYVGTGTTGQNLGATPPTNVGTYTVVATFTSANFNYASGGTAQTTFQITPAPLTVTAIGLNKPSDGTTNDPVILIDNHLGNDQITYSITSASFADANVGNGKTVTVTGISISGASAGNYTLQNTTASTTANITAAGTNPYTFDSKGRLIGVVYANGNVYVRTYASDGSSFATIINNSGVRLSDYSYSAQGVLTAYDVYYANGNVINRQFKSDGSSTGTLKDKNGNTLESYVFDTQGRLTQITYANGNVFLRSYAQDGSSTATLKNGTTLLSDYTYDTKGNLTIYDVYYANGNVFNRQYATNSATLKDSNGNVLQNYAYNTQGQLTSISDVNGNVIETLSYTSQGQLSTITFNASGNVLSYSYNSSGVLSTATLKNSSTLLLTYNYNAQGQLASVVFASNGNTQNYTYNSSGVLTTVTLTTSGNTVLQTSSYNAQGRLSAVVLASNGNTTTYNYNANGVLTSATLKDKNGNLLQTSNFNAQGQLTSVDDGNGNLIQTLSYDSESRVSTIVYAASGNILTYTYNSDGTSSAKLTTSGNTWIQTYGYDVFGRLVSINYGPGPGAGFPNGYTYTRVYASDGSSTATVKNTSNQVVETYTYDAQGNLISHNP